MLGCNGDDWWCQVAMVGLFVVVGLCVVGNAELQWLVYVWLTMLGYQLQRLCVEESQEKRENVKGEKKY